MSIYNNILFIWSPYWFFAIIVVILSIGLAVICCFYFFNATKRNKYLYWTSSVIAIITLAISVYLLVIYFTDGIIVKLSDGTALRAKNISFEGQETEFYSSIVVVSFVASLIGLIISSATITFGVYAFFKMPYNKIEKKQVHIKA